VPVIQPTTTHDRRRAQLRASSSLSDADKYESAYVLFVSTLGGWLHCVVALLASLPAQRNATQRNAGDKRETLPTVRRQRNQQKKEKKKDPRLSFAVHLLLLVSIWRVVSDLVLGQHTRAQQQAQRGFETEREADGDGELSLIWSGLAFVRGLRIQRTNEKQSTEWHHCVRTAHLGGIE
jgi:hypothetical protein